MKERRKCGKKRALLLFGILFALLFLACLCMSGETKRARASGGGAEDEARQELDDDIRELIGSLDTEELQNYLDTLSAFRGVSIKDKLMSVITGDFSLDYSSLAGAVFALIWDEGKIMLPAFAVILAVTLLCGILNSAKSDLLQSTMSDIIHFVCYLSVGATVLACLIGVLDAGFSAIFAMQKQMELIYPLLLTLMAASGGAVSVGIFRPAVAFMSGGICELFTSIVLPSSLVIIILAFVGDLTDDVRTEKLGELFKSVNKWLIGLVLGLFSVVLTVQGIASSQYDGISLKAAKYVISGSIPLVGGFLSGGVELLIAGSSLIKNALGSFAVFLLFGTILRPVLLFAVFQIFLRVSAAATEPVGGKISAFLSRLAGDCGYFLAGLLSIAFLYFLSILLLVCSTGVFF